MPDGYVVLRRSSEGGLAGIAGGAVASLSGASEKLKLTVEAAAPVKDPNVVAAALTMPMRLVRPVSTQPAVAGPMSWGIAAVGADTTTLTGQGVTVAVLDTGIDAGHEAFNGVTVVEEDFTGLGNGDEDGHGTHCAATIVGRDVSGTRIGVAPGVTRLLVGKILGPNGGTTEQILHGILWAVKNGAHVISMSVGIDFPGYQQRLTKLGFPDDIATSMALDGYRENVVLFERVASLLRAGAAFGEGAVLIAASGNESRSQLDPRFVVACCPPAVSEGFISVGAVGRNGANWSAAPFSNINPSVAAPGVEITSAALGGGLAGMSGTSMAAPHVAGVAALLIERQLDAGPFRPDRIAAELIADATTASMSPGFAPETIGAGVVQAPPS